MQEKKSLSSSAMEGISERLSSLDNLYFPRVIQDTASNPSQRKSILLDLLSRDAAVFLGEELGEFDAMKDDYEISWHLKHLRSLLSPTSEEVRSRSVMVKNRRRAYLDRLICDGQYFSEDAMRGREPYLHHEYVGKFQDPSARSMARPGERWSETLMRRSEEAILVAKIRGEQQRLDQEVVNGAQCTGGELHEEVTLSAAEMQDQMDQFTHIMQQKFLSGEDSQHLDYSKIDEDETLDDHWLREANHDAEEKYFAED
ncbi:hypothetical protein HHK36_028596 [Tetracentron sinense]|uniref:CCD97-like C-terminal domain-containing protein n=1 Tax=Tetracentron sinense TaxID=13715 RepID=A0A835D0L8_TETSI|nr:hypothetical protein HHK36_028596 [Tetracentron sinense]